MVKKLFDFTPVAPPQDEQAVEENEWKCQEERDRDPRAFGADPAGWYSHGRDCAAQADGGQRDAGGKAPEVMLRESKQRLPRRGGARGQGTERLVMMNGDPRFDAEDTRASVWVIAPRGRHLFPQVMASARRQAGAQMATQVAGTGCFINQKSLPCPQSLPH